jgi:hypothetical protein
VLEKPAKGGYPIGQNNSNRPERGLSRVGQANQATSSSLSTMSFAKEPADFEARRELRINEDEDETSINPSFPPLPHLPAEH